jgi:hypothetical protein
MIDVVYIATNGAKYFPVHEILLAALKPYCATT